MICVMHTLVCAYLDIFILHMYLKKYKIKISKLGVVLLFLPYSAIYITLNAYEALYAIKLVLCILLCVCIIWRAYQGIISLNVLKYTTIFFALLGIGELLVILIIILSDGVYEIKLFCIKTITLENFFVIVVSRVITITLIKCIDRYWHKNEVKESYTEQIFWQFMLLIIFIILIMGKHYLIDIGKHDKKDTMSIIITIFILLFICIFTRIRLLKINVIIQQQEKQIVDLQHIHEMQYRFYEERTKQENELRSIRHDLKNHLLLIKDMYEVGNVDYYQRLLDIVSNEDVIISGCIVFDILVNEKKKIAEQQKILFEVIIIKNISCINYIEEWDLCLIFGNLIDNALENAVKVESPKITVNLDIINNFFIMIISNTYDSSKIRKTRSGFLTTKEDADKHGMGLKSVEAAIEKYDGYLKFEYEQSLFRVKVLIPISNNIKKVI